MTDRLMEGKRRLKKKRKKKNVKNKEEEVKKINRDEVVAETSSTCRRWLSENKAFSLWLWNGKQTHTEEQRKHDMDFKKERKKEKERKSEITNEKKER